MEVRSPAVTRRVPQNHGRTLRTLMRRARRNRKAKTHNYAKSSTRSLYESILLAALKTTVTKGSRSKEARVISGNDHVEVTVMGGQYHIRVLTARQGCPLSCYIELLESESMQVVHVTTCTSKDRIFHTLIVESGMIRAQNPSCLQRKLCKMASNSSRK